MRVYLLAETDTFKCNEYLSLLNSYLRNEYHKILQIVHNLQRGDDTSYRKSLYQDKQATFLKLFEQIKHIETAMSDFESNLLEKSKYLIRDKLQQHTFDIQAQLEDLNNQIATGLPAPQLKTQQEKLQHLLAHISQLESATSIDTFLDALNHYLTLSHPNHT
ncbi:MAG: hypothetical protein Q4B28_01490 [bacterium]|nr:hypothetical protein [bacterium]